MVSLPATPINSSGLSKDRIFWIHIESFEKKKLVSNVTALFVGVIKAALHTFLKYASDCGCLYIPFTKTSVVADLSSKSPFMLSILRHKKAESIFRGASTIIIPFVEELLKSSSEE